LSTPPKETDSVGGLIDDPRSNECPVYKIIKSAQSGTQPPACEQDITVAGACGDIVDTCVMPGTLSLF